jgi:hypothetical protein
MLESSSGRIHARNIKLCGLEIDAEDWLVPPEPNTNYYAEICILYVQPDGSLYHGASTYGYLTTNDKGVARDFAFQINDPYLPNVQFKLQTLIWAGSTPDDPPLTYSYRTEAVDVTFK